MIYISLVLLIISIVFLIYCFKHSCYEFDLRKLMNQIKVKQFYLWS